MKNVSLVLCVIVVITAPITNAFSDIEEQVNTINLIDITSWNHVPSQHKQHEFLNQTNEAYDIKFTLNNAKASIDATLLRKLANWDKQHTNGIKLRTQSLNLTFGEYSSLNFDLTITNKNTVIPTLDNIKQYYVEALNEGMIKNAWLNELMANSPVIKITFFGENHEDQQIPTPMAKFNIAVNQFDQLLPIKIKASDLRFYWEKNYTETPATSNEFVDKKMVGILITINTSNDKTLRSYLSNLDKKNFPEIIKEKFIEVNLHINQPTLFLNSGEKK